MRRRSGLWAFALLALVVGCAGSVLAALAKSPPAFYTEAANGSYIEKSERSSALMTRVQDLQNDIRTKPEWSAGFAASDLNCFCQEMICDRASGILPENCHTPRFSIDGDRILFGFTY